VATRRPGPQAGAKREGLGTETGTSRQAVRPGSQTAGSAPQRTGGPQIQTERGRLELAARATGQAAGHGQTEVESSREKIQGTGEPCRAVRRHGGDRFDVAPGAKLAARWQGAR